MKYSYGLDLFPRLANSWSFVVLVFLDAGEPPLGLETVAGPKTLLGVIGFLLLYIIASDGIQRLG